MLAACGVMLLVHVAVERRKNKIKYSSPTPPRSRRSRGVNTQVDAGSDPADPSGDPGDELPDVVDVGGYRIQYGESTRVNVKVSRRPPQGGDMESWLRARLGRHGTNELIRQATAAWQVSESTVKRALRRIRSRP